MKILPIITLAGALSVGLASLATAQNQANPAPSSDAPNPAMKSPDATASAPLAKGRNSFTRGQAQARIQKAGYSNVQNLTLDANGLWQATATQNGQTVHIALDYKGDVASQ